MSKPCDVATDGSFTNKDEIVQFLFLIHNTNERVKDQLIEKMKTTDTLTDILNWLKLLNQWCTWRHYPKQLLQNVGNWIQPLKCMLSRNVTKVKTDVSNQILEVPVVENHPFGIQVERNMVIVVVPTFQSNVLPMAKNVSNARRRIISQNFVRVERKSQVVGSATLNIFKERHS